MRCRMDSSVLVDVCGCLRRSRLLRIDCSATACNCASFSPLRFSMLLGSGLLLLPPRRPPPLRPPPPLPIAASARAARRPRGCACRCDACQPPKGGLRAVERRGRSGAGSRGRQGGAQCHDRRPPTLTLLEQRQKARPCTGRAPASWAGPPAGCGGLLAVRNGVQEFE